MPGRSKNPIHWVEKKLIRPLFSQSAPPPNSPTITESTSSDRTPLTPAMRRSLSKLVEEDVKKIALEDEMSCIMHDPEMKLYYTTFVEKLNDLFIADAVFESGLVDVNNSYRTANVASALEAITAPSPVGGGVIGAMISALRSQNKQKREKYLKAITKWKPIFHLSNVSDQLARYSIRYHSRTNLPFTKSTLASVEATVPEVATQDFEKIIKFIKKTEPFVSEEDSAQQIYFQVTGNNAIQEPLQLTIAINNQKAPEYEALQEKLRDALNSAVQDYRPFTENCIGIWHGGRASRKNHASLQELAWAELPIQLVNLIHYLESSSQHSSLTSVSLAGHLVRALKTELDLTNDGSNKAPVNGFFSTRYLEKQKTKNDSEKVIQSLKTHLTPLINSHPTEVKMITWASKRYL